MLADLTPTPGLSSLHTLDLAQNSIGCVDVSTWHADACGLTDLDLSLNLVQTLTL